MAKPDYYEVLGVQRTSTTVEIKKAYRQKALEFHPDRNPDPAAEDTFKLCSEAYAVLSDAEKRRLYDQFGHAGLGGAGAPGFNNVGDIFSQFQDIFGEIFGGGFGFGGFSGRRRDPNAPSRGADVKTELVLSLREAAFGAKREVNLAHPTPCQGCRGTGAKGGQLQACGTCGGRGQVARAQGAFVLTTTCPACRGQGSTAAEACGDCHGSGQVDSERVVKVSVPGGVETGQSLRLAGKGQAGSRGGPAGDLYVTVYVERDPQFERNGPDLVYRLKLNYPEAALGTKIEVPVLDEDPEAKQTLKVPAGTQAGDTLRIRGAGVPELHGRGRGDLICVVELEVPRKLTREQKRLLKDLAATFQPS